ncbi:MAG TPA: hypothetical protein DEA08_38945 [Planctomycetes bacterium]|nr:hypothetical protein [Planctomycetota bacterium]
MSRRRQRESASPPPAKDCLVCGRSFAYRAKWKRCWDQVRYCSERCRRQRGSSLGPRCEAAILDLLARRRPGATICPSEAARALHEGEGEGWRELLEPVRQAARRLRAQGELRVLQRGAEVDPRSARGPIRLALPRSGSG